MNEKKNIGNLVKSKEGLNPWYKNFQMAHEEEEI